MLKVLATGSTTGPDAFAETDATAEFSDAFTIDGPGLSGQRGTVVLTIDTTSTHDITGEAAGLLSTTLQVNASNGSQGTWVQQALFASDGSVQSFSNYPGIGPVPFDPTLLAGVDFVFGEPINFGVFLLARVRGRSGPTGALASFAVDASRSAYWGGFASVSDASGSLIGAYSVSSSSGSDWSRSFTPQVAPQVPEPEIAVLLLSGFLAATFLARRRRERTLNDR